MINPLTDTSRWTFIGQRHPKLRELRTRAWREVCVNQTIEVYDFHDGREVNRRKASPFASMIAAFNQMREAVQGRLFAGVTEKFQAFGDAVKSATYDLR